MGKRGERRAEEEAMAKTMCELAKKGKMKKAAKRARDARFICTKCARAAADARHLCKAREL